MRRVFISPDCGSLILSLGSYGIMTSVRFPSCWDGVNLDSPDHMAHMRYVTTPR